MSLQKGFTLIELLIIVIIIALLAAIAIPSYQRYVIRNAESSAQAYMEQLSVDLESWRANALTYKGFEPKIMQKDKKTGEIKFIYGYHDDNNTVIYIPLVADIDSKDYQYQLTIVDGAGNSLAPKKDKKDDGKFTYTTAGNTWRILAEPSGSFANKGASKMLLTSSNAKCKSTGRDDSLTVTSSCTGKESW